jgi:hypothetical protein
MPLDAPFQLPPDAPAWARQLYGWLALVQVQADQHSVQVSRQHAAVALLKEEVMANQADIDAVVTELNDAAEEITTRIDELQAQVDAGQQVDLSQLRAAADRLRDVVPDAPQEPTA